MADAFETMLSSSKTRFKKLEKQVETTKSSKKKFDDPTYFRPQDSKDSEGNASITIRFLPAPAGEDLDFVSYFDYWFKGPTGKYYVEKSLQTLGQDDPAQEEWSRLFNAGKEGDEESAKLAKARGRRPNYVSNILVLKDEGNPENVGKVLRWKYGAQIFTMIEKAMQGDPDAEIDPLNPFDLLEGANFLLKIKKKNKYDNYEDSKFLTPKPLDEDTDKLREIWNRCHPLASIIADDQFKSYDELKKEYEKVVGYKLDESDDSEPKVKAKPTSSKKVLEEDDGDDNSIPFDLDDEPKTKTTAKTEVVSEDDDEDFDIGSINLDDDDK